MPKVSPYNKEELTPNYYLVRKNMIKNKFDRGELNEIRACELMSYLKFVQATKQPMDKKLITNSTKIDPLENLLKMHDDYIKENFYDIIKQNGDSGVRLCCINAIRSLLSADYLPTKEDVMRLLECGTYRPAYEKLFIEFGCNPKDLYLSFSTDSYNPNCTMEEFHCSWVDKETARYIRSGKFNEEVSRQVAERKWNEISDPKKERLFLKFCGVL